MESVSIQLLIKKSNDILKDFDNSPDKQELLDELDGMVGYLTSALKKITNTSNICKNKMLLNDFNVFRDSPDLKINNVLSYKYIAPKVKLPVIQLENIDQVPDMPLFWIKNINQFAFKLNGVLFRGNIGNISTAPCKRVKICEHRNQCVVLLEGKICDNYHDPIDLNKLLRQRLISGRLYKKYINLSRNFSNVSWLYTPYPINKKNYYMRHFGSREILRQELDKKYLFDIETYGHQCIHDILVYLGVSC